jgi:hypothetical protein
MEKAQTQDNIWGPIRCETPVIDLIREGAGDEALSMGKKCGFEELDPRDCSGPLHVALECGQEQLALDMLAAGTVSKRNVHGIFPLMIAASRGLTRAVKALRLHTPPLARDADGYTALMHACLWGKTDSALLLADASSMAEKNADDKTAIEIAAMGGYWPCAIAIMGMASLESLNKAAMERGVDEKFVKIFRRMSMAEMERQELGRSVVDSKHKGNKHAI